MRDTLLGKSSPCLRPQLKRNLPCMWNLFQISPATFITLSLEFCQFWLPTLWWKDCQVTSTPTFSSERDTSSKGYNELGPLPGTQDISVWFSLPGLRPAEQNPSDLSENGLPVVSSSPTTGRNVLFSTWRLICLQGKLMFVTEKSAYLIGPLVRESAGLSLSQEENWN